MKLSTHGGGCCGIYHIYGLGLACNGGLSQQMASKQNTKTLGMTSLYTPDHGNSFTDEAPVETSLERLDRIIAFFDKHRKNGILEIITAKYNNIHVQYEIWHKPLLARGFVEVSSCHNSNSGNRIHVYHRCKDKE